jgi:hypothetical protein
MPMALTHNELEALLVRLKPGELDCRAKIVQLRRLMDEACDQRTVTLHQWRSLRERISLVQAEHVQFEPDGWGYPPIVPEGSGKFK